MYWQYIQFVVGSPTNRERNNQFNSQQSICKQCLFNSYSLSHLFLPYVWNIRFTRSLVATEKERVSTQFCLDSFSCRICRIRNLNFELWIQYEFYAHAHSFHHNKMWSLFTCNSEMLWAPIRNYGAPLRHLPVWWARNVYQSSNAPYLYFWVCAFKWSL